MYRKTQQHLVQSGSELDQGVKSELYVLFQSTFIYITCTVTQKELSISQVIDLKSRTVEMSCQVHTSHRVDLRMWP